MGMLSKYPDFCQLSMIEKFERFEKKSNPKISIPPCQIRKCGCVFTSGMPRPLFIKSRVLLVTETEKTEKV